MTTRYSAMAAMALEINGAQLSELEPVVVVVYGNSTVDLVLQ